MSRKSDAANEMNRRSLLKTVGAATAAGTVLSAAGTVVADDVGTRDQWYEYKCEAETCQYGGTGTQYRRSCYNDPEAGTVCSNWETYGCC